MEPGSATPDPRQAIGERPPLACPFCHGQVTRLNWKERRASAGVVGTIGALLVYELAFYGVVVLLFILSFWSLVAAASLLVVGGLLSGWLRYRRATFRCESCRSVLMHKEVKRAR